MKETIDQKADRGLGLAVVYQMLEKDAITNDYTVSESFKRELAKAVLDKKMFNKKHGLSEALGYAIISHAYPEAVQEDEAIRLFEVMKHALKLTHFPFNNW